MFDPVSPQSLESSSCLDQPLLTQQHQQQLLAQRYLQSPLSIAWSKLETLFQTNQVLRQPDTETSETYQSEPSDSPLDGYPNFTDRVDPALYYSIFFSPSWY
jgi:hypothetical protein